MCITLINAVKTKQSKLVNLKNNSQQKQVVKKKQIIPCKQQQSAFLHL